jgi:hypothetical protein
VYRLRSKEVKISPEPIQSNLDKCTKCVSIIRAHATTQRSYAVLRSEFPWWQLIRILCSYPGSTVQARAVHEETAEMKRSENFAGPNTRADMIGVMDGWVFHLPAFSRGRCTTKAGVSTI